MAIVDEMLRRQIAYNFQRWFQQAISDGGVERINCSIQAQYTVYVRYQHAGIQVQ